MTVAEPLIVTAADASAVNGAGLLVIGLATLAVVVLAIVFFVRRRR